MLLTEEAKKLLTDPEVGILGTVMTDSQPHQAVVWVTYDPNDDTVLFTTTRGSQKHKNLEHNNHASILIYPHENPNSYIEIRGEVVISTPKNNALLNKLIKKYTGVEKPLGPSGGNSVTVRLTPEKIFTRQQK